MTRKPDEFASVTGRRDDTVVWGLGGHPSVMTAHESFDADRFRELLVKAAVVGEIGLDPARRLFRMFNDERWMRFSEFWRKSLDWCLFTVRERASWFSTR